jgi:cystine transport system ATP-binding protein
VAVLGDLAREGMTMLMATHDLRLAAQVASHTVFLQDGAVVEAGPSEVIFGAAQDARTRAFVQTLST